MAQVNTPSRELPNTALGRPSSYCTELADEICERLACGESLRTICADDGMPHRTTVIRWLSRHAAQALQRPSRPTALGTPAPA